jgi:hypothetical protein
VVADTTGTLMGGKRRMEKALFTGQPILVKMSMDGDNND